MDLHPRRPRQTADEDRRPTARSGGLTTTEYVTVIPNRSTKLLRKMGFSLRVNHKKLSGTSADDRDAQFGRIGELRERFAAQRLPVISIDTKKRELVGHFKNGGAAWDRDPVLVNDHDFRSDALGIAIPYGIYDVQANRGTFFVGTTYDTPDFAVDSVETWWRTEGVKRYRDAKQLAILADAGGSNAPRNRAWKCGLQDRLCNCHGLTITVAHYPTGASKWNPIEHRLFSEVTKNWAARPLDSYETILNYLRTTTTNTGLRVEAHLVDKPYVKGVKITDDQMDQLQITNDEELPRWNYTLRPA
ncbi:MAG TPA: ISAzo13 family transposase [Thermoanaerobaculia bacterium]|nr:ISAzo13 family transposase [Thermoanaerobaculia bacterium]